METSLSRAFCELHMILSLLHALTPTRFSSIAQALICWDLSYCQVQCLNQYTNRLDKSTSHKFLKVSEASFNARGRAATERASKSIWHNQPGKKIKGLLESLIHEMLLWSYEEDMFFFLVTYAGIAIKLYQVSIHVHTCPSVATDDREHFQFLNTDCWYPFSKNNFGL